MSPTIEGNWDEFQDRLWNYKPLVTCLCLTMAGRSEFLKRAVACFARQTYANRELLIVADSIEDGTVAMDAAGMVPAGTGISVYVPLQKSSIGRKRNLGCGSAEGEIICHWDDDDYSAPSRIEKQVKRIQESKACVTASDTMFFTDGSDWWKFHYPEGFAAGTSLMFRRDWWKDHQFDEGEYAIIGEDCRFITEAHEAGVFAPVALLDMYASIHPGNTSKKQPLGPGWTPLPGFVWRD